MDSKAGLGLSCLGVARCVQELGGLPGEGRVVQARKVSPEAPPGAAVSSGGTAV